MAGRAVTFFGPASLVGTQTIYTPFTDVSDANTLTARFRVTGAIGTAPTLDVTMQHANTPNEDDVQTLGSAFTQATGSGSEDKVFTDDTDKMMSLVRAKVEVGGTDPGFTFEIAGTARSE